MDPKALEALPPEKATKMELKRGQVGFHWSATKYQQRYRIERWLLCKSLQDRMTW